MERQRAVPAAVFMLSHDFPLLLLIRAAWINFVLAFLSSPIEIDSGCIIGDKIFVVPCIGFEIDCKVRLWSQAMAKYQCVLPNLQRVIVIQVYMVTNWHPRGHEFWLSYSPRLSFNIHVWSL